jgi:hypothetical protein
MVSFDYLKEVAGSDRQFVAEMATAFLHQVPEFVTNFSYYLESRQYIKLAKEAHTAKSTVLLFELKEVEEMLRQLQHLAEKEEDIEMYPVLVGQINLLLNQAANEVTVWLHENHS